MNYGLLNFSRLSITIVANRLQWLFHFRLGCAFILKWLQGPLDRSGMSTGINNNNYIKKAVFTPMMIIYISSSQRSLFHKHLKVPSSYLIKKKGTLLSSIRLSSRSLLRQQDDHNAAVLSVSSWCPGTERHVVHVSNRSGGLGAFGQRPVQCFTLPLQSQTRVPGSYY